MQAIERYEAVESRTGLDRATIKRLIAEGSFPRPVKLTKRAVGFVSQEVDEFITAKIEQRDREAA